MEQVEALAGKHFALQSTEYLFGLMAFRVAKFPMQIKYLLVIHSKEKRYSLRVITHVFPLISHWSS